jgi:DNA-binding protein HU-beta
LVVGATKTGISKKTATEVLECIAQLAYENAKNTFTLPGLGNLVLVNRKARMGRNPATGERLYLSFRLCLSHYNRRRTALLRVRHRLEPLPLE